jgi:hypothetical protein
MPGEGVVSVGATFDKTNVDAGLGSTQEMFKATMEGITNDIVQANAKSRAAFKGLSDGVKESAATMNAEALKLAEATRAVVAAKADERRAFVLSKDAKIEDTQRTSILAAAQTRLAETQAAAAAATRAEAAAVAAAAEEAALSSNLIVAGFQRAGIRIMESMKLAQESLISTAETGKISAEGMTAGFAGLGALLGAGVFIGFAAHFLDEIVKVEVELGHLAEKTKISVEYLAGLQEIVHEMGGEWDPIASGIFRMERNLADSKKPSEEFIKALSGIRLTLDDLKGLKPEEQFEKIASALVHNSNAGNQANAAIAIFGKGGAALVPVLDRLGDNLHRLVEEHGKLTGITTKSVEAAEVWQQTTARLSAELHSVLVPTILVVEKSIAALIAVFELAAATIVSAFEVVATAIVSIFAPLSAVARMMKDVLTGNWGDVKGAVEAERDAFVGTWKNGFDTIKGNWTEAVSLLTWSPKKDEGIPAIDKFDEGDPGDPAKVKKGPRNAAFEADKQALDALKLDHQVTLEEEIKFWQERLATAKKGSDEYKSIMATLAPLVQKEDKKPKADPNPMMETESPDMSAANAAFSAGLAEQVKATQTAIKEETEAYRDQAEEKMVMAHEDYEDAERAANFEVQMGRMSAQQRINILRQAALQEDQIRQQQSKFIEMLDMNDVRKYDADLKREVQATRQSTREMTQLNQQAALQVQKSWQQAFDKMTTQINQDVAKWIVSGQSFEKSMAKAMAGISENFISNLLKMMEQEILAMITHKSLMSQKIIADAHAAAASAYNWADDWGGPVAGAIAAAAAFAGVMAFDSFAAGGVVQGGGGMAVPILAHAGERVLSPAQTANFEKMVSHSSSSSVIHQNNNVTQNLNGYDRAGMKSALRDHADSILDIVRSGYRSGALSA